MGEHSVILELKDIFFSYPFGKNVFDKMDFKLCQGEKIGLIGPNGSGKTTFLHMLMGLLHPDSGSIKIFGELVQNEKDFRKAREGVGYLFQNADDQLFSPTVLEDVAFGPLNLGKTRQEAIDLSMETLEKLNLKGFETRITHKLSGGEKKLVALATILVMKPELLLLDEPTTGLDERTTLHIIDILNSLKISCIIVSHEYDFLARTTRNIYSMGDGKIEYNSSSKDLHSHYHSHPMGGMAHTHKKK